MTTLVIGLGNPILTDDGVGIYTARFVEQALPGDADVEVVELAVGGLCKHLPSGPPAKKLGVSYVSMPETCQKR